MVEFFTLKQAQFDLRKWTSSDPELVLSLPPDYREANENFKTLDKEHTIKTSVTVWKFHLAISKSITLKAESISKHQMMSDNAQTFDPLG